MKKYLNILVALALILAGLLGYRSNRPRPLSQCFPEGVWEDVRVSFYMPIPGESGENLYLDVTPEELKEAMEETPVFRLFQPKNQNCGVLGLRLFIDGEPVAAEIFEDGSMAVQNHQGDWVCWRAANEDLYELLTRP